MKQIKILLTYLVVGLSGILAAFFISSQWVTPSLSQEGSPLPLAEAAPDPAASDEAELPPPPPPAAEEDSESNVEDFSFLEPFAYDAQEGRRDPFKPTASKPTGPGVISGPESTVLLPLQRFDIDDVKLVGIMWHVKSPKAMFMDPNNTVHIIGVDERIGRNNGYVAVIREGEVVIVETQRMRGELVYTTRVLRITSK